MNIGKRIQLCREKIGLSVDQLADILGKDRSTIYRYENGDIEKLPTTVLEPLAKALQTTPAYLMGWVESTDSEKKNDTITDIILKLRSDNNYLEVCYNLQNLNPEQLEAVKTFLTVFQKQDINQMD